MLVPIAEEAEAEATMIRQNTIITKDKDPDMTESFQELILDDLGYTHGSKNPFQMASADLIISDNSGLQNRMNNHHQMKN